MARTTLSSKWEGLKAWRDGGVAATSDGASREEGAWWWCTLARESLKLSAKMSLFRFCGVAATCTSDGDAFAFLDPGRILVLPGR